MERIHKELSTKHGVAILSKIVGSNRLDYIIVETPIGHTSHHHPKESDPTKITPLQLYKGPGYGRDENAVVHQLVKKIQLAENV